MVTLVTGCSFGWASRARLPMPKVPEVIRNISAPMTFLKFAYFCRSITRAAGEVLIAGARGAATPEGAALAMGAAAAAATAAAIDFGAATGLGAATARATDATAT